MRLMRFWAACQTLFPTAAKPLPLPASLLASSAGIAAGAAAAFWLVDPVQLLHFAGFEACFY